MSGFSEEAGEGWLAPVRPTPHPILRKQWRILLSAHRDRLASWREHDYRATVAPFRLLKRRMVLVNTPEGVRHVLSTRNDNYERKSPQMRRALEFLIGDGLFISDGSTWAHRRPLVSDIVGKSRRLPGYGAQMAAAAREMADAWTGRDGPVDMLTEMGVLTAGIISRTIFGVQLERRDALQVTAAFAEYQRRIDVFNLGYLLGDDEGWPVWKGLRLRIAARRVQAVVDKAIDAQLSGRGDHTLMLDLMELRRQKDPGGPVGRDVLRDEAATLFMAGHETTAATLAWAWYLLAKAPWAEAAVHREIAEVCGERAPEYDDLPRLAYCRAVIEETLRLYPPVALLARQAREADRIGKVEVDPGAVVIVSPWLLHRSPDLWEAPERLHARTLLRGRAPLPLRLPALRRRAARVPGHDLGLVEAVLCLATLPQQFAPRLAWKRPRRDPGPPHPAPPRRPADAAGTPPKAKPRSECPS